VQKFRSGRMGNCGAGLGYGSVRPTGRGAGRGRINSTTTASPLPDRHCTHQAVVGKMSIAPAQLGQAWKSRQSYPWIREAMRRPRCNRRSAKGSAPTRSHPWRRRTRYGRSPCHWRANCYSAQGIKEAIPNRQRSGAPGLRGQGLRPCFRSSKATVKASYHMPRPEVYLHASKRGGPHPLEGKLTEPNLQRPPHRPGRMALSSTNLGRDVCSAAWLRGHNGNPG